MDLLTERVRMKIFDNDWKDTSFCLESLNRFHSDHCKSRNTPTSFWVDYHLSVAGPLVPGDQPLRLCPQLRADRFDAHQFVNLSPGIRVWVYNFHVLVGKVTCTVQKSRKILLICLECVALHLFYLYRLWRSASDGSPFRLIELENKIFFNCWQLVRSLQNYFDRLFEAPSRNE
jgi:hypothetical protein